MKVKVSSSSEDEEVFASKENCPAKEMTFPPFPQIDRFMSTSTPLQEVSMPRVQNMLSNKEVNSHIQTKINNVIDIRDDNGDSADKEFKKQVLFKLNKLLYKADKQENMLHVLEGKIQFQDIEIDEECDISLPIVSLEELNTFEEKLQESQFAHKVVNILKLVGGNSMHIMTHKILSKVMVNTVAIHFSWAGKKKKLIFKNLRLAKIIMQTVRLHTQHKQTTDAQFAESISKWLAQAPLRSQRELKCAGNVQKL